MAASCCGSRASPASWAPSSAARSLLGRHMRALLPPAQGAGGRPLVLGAALLARRPPAAAGRAGRAAQATADMMGVLIVTVGPHCAMHVWLQGLGRAEGGGLNLSRGTSSAVLDCCHSGPPLPRCRPPLTARHRLGIGQGQPARPQPPAHTGSQPRAWAAPAAWPTTSPTCCCAPRRSTRSEGPWGALPALHLPRPPAPQRLRGQALDEARSWDPGLRAPRPARAHPPPAEPLTAAAARGGLARAGTRNMTPTRRCGRRRTTPSWTSCTWWRTGCRTCSW